jgi:hypothetical protein
MQYMLWGHGKATWSRSTCGHNWQLSPTIMAFSLALASNRDKNVRIAGTVLAYKSMSDHWRGIRVYYTDNWLNRGGERDMGDQVE